jgi:hypothetical protein
MASFLGVMGLWAPLGVVSFFHNFDKKLNQDSAMQNMKDVRIKSLCEYQVLLTCPHSKITATCVDTVLQLIGSLCAFEWKTSPLSSPLKGCQCSISLVNPLN